MENRIDCRLAELKERGEHGLMCHIVLGYPDLEASERLLMTLAGSGADLVELQIPFTDPLADGPTILGANLAALEKGIRVRDCFRFAERMAPRLPDTPLLFMTYVNIPFSYGLSDFCRDSASAGVQGLIVPDIPPDEKDEPYRELCLEHSLHPIYILSPSSTERRMALIGENASGFVYCTARVGITGARDKGIPGLKDFISRVRKHTSLPLALGFGISGAEQVREVSRMAEVSIVGSKVIDTYDSGTCEEDSLERVSAFIRGLRG